MIQHTCVLFQRKFINMKILKEYIHVAWFLHCLQYMNAWLSVDHQYIAEYCMQLAYLHSDLQISIDV